MFLMSVQMYIISLQSFIYGDIERLLFVYILRSLTNEIYEIYTFSIKDLNVLKFCCSVLKSPYMGNLKGDCRKKKEHYPSLCRFIHSMGDIYV